MFNNILKIEKNYYNDKIDFKNKKIDFRLCEECNYLINDEDINVKGIDDNINKLLSFVWCKNFEIFKGFFFINCRWCFNIVVVVYKDYINDIFRNKNKKYKYKVLICYLKDFFLEKKIFFLENYLKEFEIKEEYLIFK